MASDDAQHGTICAAFVEARQAGKSVEVYPGRMPETLEEAYQIQDRAIDSWPDDVVGWKVGGIGAADATKLGAAKLAGPVFRKLCSESASDGETVCPTFVGGFAALEAEIVAVIARDAPADKMQWSAEEAAEMIESVHAGIEVASSPFPGINSHGAAVTVSDFGNNYGLIRGPALADGLSGLESIEVTTTIDGAVVGTKAVTANGPVESVRFLLENTARRGRPLRRGMFVLTGAITGVHQVHHGQSGDACFKGLATLKCRFTPFLSSN